MTEPISHIVLVAALAKPGQDIINELTPDKAHCLHMAVGIAGEAVELLANIDQTVALGLELDRPNAVEEGGDIEFFVEGLFQGLKLRRIPMGMRAAGSKDIIHSVINIVLASGDVLDMVKRLTIYNKPLTSEDFIPYLDKLEMALADFRLWANITRDEMIRGNIAKLSKRYASMSYSNEQAQARADKAEA